MGIAKVEIATRSLTTVKPLQGWIQKLARGGALDRQWLGELVGCCTL